MSNKKKSRTDGIIPTVGGGIATPTNSSNIPTSDYSYTDKTQIARKTKQNNLK